MGVGDSLELPYELPGPLPAGPYRLVVTGFQDSRDGVIRGEVFHVPAGSSAYQLIVSADGTPPGAGGGNTYLDATVQGPAVAAACGDTLYYRVTVLSGSQAFYEVFLELDIP